MQKLRASFHFHFSCHVHVSVVFSSSNYSFSCSFNRVGHRLPENFPRDLQFRGAEYFALKDHRDHCIFPLRGTIFLPEERTGVPERNIRDPYFRRYLPVIRYLAKIRGALLCM